ncbi:MAG: DUF6118 family protein [Caulobacteraceae bacterium]
MTTPPEAPRTRDPAVAFDEMRGELALLRRAIERLAAERAEAPDYSESLGQITASLASTRKTLRAILERPALELTPEVMGARIHAAADQVRRADKSALAEALAALTRATGALNDWIESARQASVQNWRLIQAALAGLVGGAVLWAVTPGVVAGLAPQSWGWPERLAALTLGGDPWIAGERLLAIGDPGRWQAMVRAKRLADDNAPAIEACATAARKEGKPVRCVVTFDPRVVPSPR